MSEEFGNENNECNCTEEGKENCTCKDDCHCDDNCDCEEVVTYECCSTTEKLYVVSAVANIITTVLVAAIACAIFFNGTSFSLPERAEKAPAKAQKHGGAIFNKKGMSLDKAMKDKKTAIVLFYADWCPHCQNFGPTFKELEKDRNLKKNFNFVRINSEDPASRKYMEEYGIQGFPSLFMVNPQTGEKQQIENYLMFGDNAKETLSDIFVEFSEK